MSKAEDEYVIKQKNRGTTYGVYAPNGQWFADASTLWGARRIVKRHKERVASGYFKEKEWHI